MVVPPTAPTDALCRSHLSNNGLRSCATSHACGFLRARSNTVGDYAIFLAVLTAAALDSPAGSKMNGVALTYGPILLGGAVALMLSGIVAVQCIIFFKLYPDEGNIKMAIVSTVWLLDITQSLLIVAALFHYFILHFGDSSVQSSIPWSIALTILVTAMQTCVVHLFYAQKIYRSSGKNWWITVPIVLLATLRLLAAILATIEMLRLKQWAVFFRPYPHFLFTAGLSLSAGTDMVITACLCFYMRRIRKLSTSSVWRSSATDGFLFYLAALFYFRYSCILLHRMKGVLDTLTLYTLENGLITCLTTVGALVFWLVMPLTSLSLSLHFVIGKLYPNSLLVLLNTRKELREMHSGDPGKHFDTSDHLTQYYTHFPHRAPLTSRFPLTTFPPRAYGYQPTFKMHTAVEVQIEKTVQRDSAAISEASFDPERPYAAYAYAAPRSLGNTSLNWRALP
ncbi:hypothetical protein B0H13DRAFT_2261905 [Mycena leptocephala]|nr:hypothetical protein B0H13DRAFT_2261905 [Mycena leptocephala]